MSPTLSQIAFERILIPLDFSSTSITALPFAVEMASRYHAKLLALHVIPEAEYQTADAKSKAAERIRQTLAHRVDVPYDVLIEYGDIANRLPLLITSSGTDLLVLGTHGSHGLEKLVRGSVAQEIICACEVPVLAVGAQVTRTPAFKHILYATDFSAASEAAFLCAVSIARRFDASLVFLHVNEWSSQEPPVEAQAKTFQFFERHIADTGVSAIDFHRDVLVKFGARADQILDVAAARATDLIVMGLRCKHGLMARVSAHLPGPLSYEVMSQAPCPVISVPAKNH